MNSVAKLHKTCAEAMTTGDYTGLKLSSGWHRVQTTEAFSSNIGLQSTNMAHLTHTEQIKSREVNDACCCYLLQLIVLLPKPLSN